MKNEMTKQDFLTRLQRDLNGRIGSKNAASFIEYYQEYIEIELRRGRSIEELMEHLGPPELIARSVAETFRRKEQKMSKGKGRGSYGSRLKDKVICLYRKIYGKAREWFEHL